MDKEHIQNSDTELILEEELKAALVNGRLPCAIVFKISHKFKVNPQKVGSMANRLNLKISNCQLGCFP